MIDPTRVRVLREEGVRESGKYVLYWMQASQRTRFNHALEYAIGRANELGLPLVVGFGLMDDYPEANARHYAFMLQGLRDVAAGLDKRGVSFVVRHGHPSAVALETSRDAALIVCDRGYLRHQKQWRDEVADGAACEVVEVESDVVVPVEIASDKHEFAARTLRPRIHRHLADYLRPLRPARPRVRGQGLSPGGSLEVSDPLKLLAKLKLDRSVAPSPRFIGGERAAAKLLKRFVTTKLRGYATERNDPSRRHTSTMSAYLHFGQISPLEIALAVESASASRADRDAYLEELIVRRELSINFAHYNPRYDDYDGLPEWARKTLAEHRRDPRPYGYSREQLERAQTHDVYWNAAQLEMTRTGFMHNYMRMYWGKKILEWKRTPQEAYADAIYLNNKYFLCGRDPNAWANVGWLFGLHDRPWGPARKIFGLVRYMNAAGLERKFDMEAYVKWAESLKPASP
jgi:deoxyribodipyrimidine photo-lyase